MPGMVLGARETKIKIQDLPSQRLWLKGQIETKTTTYTTCWQVSTRHSRTQKGRQQMCLKRAGKPPGRVTLNEWRGEVCQKDKEMNEHLQLVDSRCQDQEAKECLACPFPGKRCPGVSVSHCGRKADTSVELMRALSWGDQD